VNDMCRGMPNLSAMWPPLIDGGLHINKSGASLLTRGCVRCVLLASSHLLSRTQETEWYLSLLVESLQAATL